MSASPPTSSSSDHHRRSPSPEHKPTFDHNENEKEMNLGYRPDEKSHSIRRGSRDLESGSLSTFGSGLGSGSTYDLGSIKKESSISVQPPSYSNSTTTSASASASASASYSRLGPPRIGLFSGKRSDPGGKLTGSSGGGGGGGGVSNGNKRVSATVVVPIWITLSAGVIVFNKWLYSTAGFPYPIFLTSYHLGGAAVGTRILRMFTPLMNGLDEIDMTREKYIKNILPIGVLFSGSLILSNMAYLTLSVSFIQMLKAFHPVAILLISAVFKIQSLTRRLIVIVLCISIGCCMAALGELEFELFGFLCQASAVIFESSRLVMIQLLLQGLKMDPLCSLHYYAPICAIINACFVPFTEGWAPFIAFPKIGFFIMGLNALNAFLLNVAAVFLIGAAGGLVLTLAGVFKDILLITSSTLFFGSKISPMQIFGYVIALTGLILFKTAGK